MVSPTYQNAVVDYAYGSMAINRYSIWETDPEENGDRALGVRP